jgi:ATP-dependent exoDNAse (exonuclease V) beta subunit
MTAGLPSELAGATVFTLEQRAAIESATSVLLLDASAGSGKTSVLVERFVRAVLEDGAGVGSILAITFTEKAANEMRERIRARLRERGAEEAARATDGAQISTIHGFCARLLRSNALAAGLDPAFTVLDEHEAARLAADAFDAALAEFAAGSRGSELIAAHGAGPLRDAIVAVHERLRSLGSARPALPHAPPAADDEAISRVRRAVLGAAQRAAAELGAVEDPPARVVQALQALGRARELLERSGCPWPGDLGAIALPPNGAALQLRACDCYRSTLAELKVLCEHRYAAVTRLALDELLAAYDERYAEGKRQRSGVDFEDLELMARDLLLRPEIAARIRERFTHILVDELQDTNRLQWELIDLLAADNLFMVGDAQQSIYGFRHAQAELFEERGRSLEGAGGRLSLHTNFRSRLEIVSALNAAFRQLLGERFRPLVAGRVEGPATDPLVELLIVDKGADWESDALAAPWRQAEARVLSARVAELISDGHPASEIVVLTRASTDLRVYERALEEAGVPTYMIGGRGYWSHPQVVELVCYLRALANPLDVEALYVVWCSPLCGLSLDGLVLAAAGASDELAPDDAGRLEAFEQGFAAERSRAALLGPEELLVRATERAGYVPTILSLHGGHRRLANVRKLLRVAREWEAERGSDLHGFLELVARREEESDRESEAPVESEALDAVRLMTIHRAKGLEFDVVCVADLARGPTHRAELIRLSRDGERLGLRLAQPGTAARVPALDYVALGDEQAEQAASEERRLFYVAMTRARERLILSGAARMDTWSRGHVGTPIDWIAPAFVPDIATDQSSRVTDLGVRVTFVRAEEGVEGRVFGGAPTRPAEPPGSAEPPSHSEPPPLIKSPPLGPPLPPVDALSYSALAQYQRCGYRFYVERVLHLPPVETVSPATSDGPDGAWSDALDRGTALHSLLERIDFQAPRPPSPAELGEMGLSDAGAVRNLFERFAASDTCARLARAGEIRREQSFALDLGNALPLLTGAFDVLAREGGERLLVVDYKSDRLEGAPPEQALAERYLLQRRIYALAALRTGAPAVEVVHLFLEAPEAPCARTFTPADIPVLERELGELAAAIVHREFPVAEQPWRALCRGCPAEGGMCSWPLELTRREVADGRAAGRHPADQRAADRDLADQRAADRHPADQRAADRDPADRGADPLS